MTPSEKLCLACGMCCDGTLFDNVRLGPGDNASQLKAQGLPVMRTRGQAPVTLFRQPCAALCGDRTCRVYAIRPGQCRAFECGVFKDAAVGKIKFAAAVRAVKHARQQADAIRKMLRKLGDHDEQRSLSERFRRTLQRLETQTPDPAAAATCAKLGQAMHAFALLKHERFYTRTG